MRVSIHARDQLTQRLPADVAAELLARLADAGAPRVNEARIVHRFDTSHFSGDGQSNGDLVIVIVEDGVIVTAFQRRSSQPLTPAALRVSRVRDWTRPPGSLVDAQDYRAGGHILVGPEDDPNVGSEGY